MDVELTKKIGLFSGQLKLDNTGSGFSSFRATDSWNLTQVESIQFSVFGDGHQYKLLVKDQNLANLNQDVSLQVSFKTIKNKWTKLNFPINSFKLNTTQGLSADFKIDLAEVVQLGLQIESPESGDFDLKFSEIKAIFKN